MSRIILAILLFTLSFCACDYFLPITGVCENSVEKELKSPNGKLNAIIFDRGCGATVGFITGISIIPADEKLNSSDTGNVLLADILYGELSERGDGEDVRGKVNFEVEWVNDSELIVRYV